MRLALVLLVACSSYEPKPESEADADEAMVVTFEEMARLAADKPTCVHWAEENGRRWGKRRLQTMVERMQKFEPAKQEAFRAKVRQAHRCCERGGARDFATLPRRAARSLASPRRHAR